MTRDVAVRSPVGLLAGGAKLWAVSALAGTLTRVDTDGTGTRHSEPLGTAPPLADLANVDLALLPDAVAVSSPTADLVHLVDPAHLVGQGALSR
jgi:hypothetical protein